MAEIYGYENLTAMSDSQLDKAIRDNKVRLDHGHGPYHIMAVADEEDLGLYSGYARTELKDIDYWDVTIAGTGKTVDAATVKRNMGAADIDGQDATKIVPRNYLKDEDFTDFWWIGPVGRNSETDYIAIHLKNALSTDGFQMQTQNADKGSFPFTYTAHSSVSW